LHGEAEGMQFLKSDAFQCCHKGFSHSFVCVCVHGHVSPSKHTFWHTSTVLEWRIPGEGLGRIFFGFPTVPQYFYSRHSRKLAMTCIYVPNTHTMESPPFLTV